MIPLLICSLWFVGGVMCGVPRRLPSSVCLTVLTNYQCKFLFPLVRVKVVSLAYAYFELGGHSTANISKQLRENALRILKMTFIELKRLLAMF